MGGGGLYFPGGVGWGGGGGAINFLVSYFVFAVSSHSLIIRPLSSSSRRVRMWMEISPNTEARTANN